MKAHACDKIYSSNKALYMLRLHRWKQEPEKAIQSQKCKSSPFQKLVILSSHPASTREKVLHTPPPPSRDYKRKSRKEKKLTNSL